MEPRLEHVTEKSLVGMKMRMSLTGNKTGLLWQGFMPRRSEIENRLGEDLYSIEVYGSDYFNAFRPDAEFEKWAAVEVSRVETVPDDMEVIVIPAGLYAVFLLQGPPSLGPKLYEYVLGTWLPASAYRLDTRPHFAVMGQKYKHNDPSSEEELWFPIVSNEQR